MDHALMAILAGLLMAIGVVGTLLPIVPGLVLVWGAAVVYGLASGFGTVGWISMAVITVLLAVSLIKSVLLPRKAAVDSGASTNSQLVGAAAGVVGFFVIPIIGLPIGLLGGIFLAERAIQGNSSQAWTSTKGVAKGLALSALIDFVLGIVMILAWLPWLIANWSDTGTLG